MNISIICKKRKVYLQKLCTLVFLSSHSPLREVELSCRFGIVLAGGQKVFFGTGNHVVFSPSLRWDSSKINFPSLKNFKRPPGVGGRLLSMRASVWWAGWGLEFLPFALARVGCSADGSREHISVVPLTWAAWAWHSADFSRMLILYRYPFSSTGLLILKLSSQFDTIW